MGRKSELSLEVKAPSFFRCPISLEVMRSPVSLCTGVTYDRSSIQRWLDSGNTTCPATNLTLPSTDLVPNLTLRRLIHHWSSPSKQNEAFAPADLLLEIRSSADPLPPLQKLADFFSYADESERNGFINSGEFAPALVSLLKNSAQLEVMEAAIRVLSLILTVNCIEKSKREIAISALLSDLNGSVESLIAVIKSGTRLESRTNAGTVLNAILSSPSCDDESKVLISEKADLFPEMIRLIGPSDDGTMDRTAIDAGLGCLIGLTSSSAARRVRAGMVRAGVVPMVAHVLSYHATELPARAAERAIKVMELAAGCAEGRAAIGEDAERIVGAVVGRMMKVGREGSEAAVGMLWGVCYAAGGDRRARKAVAGVCGGMAKILMLIQGDCSPEVRRMSGDLLRVFRVDEKGKLAGYDTRTTHIMPF